MLVALLRRFDLPDASAIRSRLAENLSAENLLVEAEYMRDSARPSFERMYGWAWLLKLAQELLEWEDVDSQSWSAHLEPLVEAVTARYLAFLPKQTYPIRAGTHANTAFGLTFALDYAKVASRADLAEAIEQAALRYYGHDEDAPQHVEPSGADFLSPTLVEADLMRRVLPPDSFVTWIDRFLGGVLLLDSPAIVADRADPQIGHLDGLNLSRAWCMRGIGSVLPEEHRLRRQLLEAADRHAQAGLANVTTGHYEGEHWLASFAVYLLTL
jgi:hypothetical protein